MSQNSNSQQHQKQQDAAAASVFHPVESKKGASANPGASKESSAVAKTSASATNDSRQQEMAVSLFFILY